LRNNKNGLSVLFEIADRTRMVFIRVRSAIRADGTPSAQLRAQRPDRCIGGLAR